MAMKKLSLLVVMVLTITGYQSTVKLHDTPKSMVEPITKIMDGDDDQDGVLNSMDGCPNTPINVVVDGRGCEVQPACYDCDVPNYSTSLYFNRNETYPTEDVLYDYGTPIGKKYVDNKGKMDGIIKNLANIKANIQNFLKRYVFTLKGIILKGNMVKTTRNYQSKES